MTASPSAGGDLRVTPSALGEAAGLVRTLGEGVRQSSTGLLAGLMVGDPACGEALASAARLVAQALHTSAAGIDQLAQTLEGAEITYGVADERAVPRRAGGPQ